MPIQKTTLRPGLLVGLNTSIIGNVSYQQQTIEADHLTAEGAREAEWNTRRKVADAAEMDEADKLRSKARTLITGVCAKSAFGIICPEDKADKLEKVVAEARAIAEEFNSRARITRIRVNVICGRISPSDEVAMKAINGEIRDLIDEMQAGVRAMDVEAIRAAALKAKSVGQMLSTEAQAQIESAIQAARSTATAINKAGETASREVDKVTLARLAEARTAFLDLDEPTTQVAAPVAEARAVDFEPMEEAPVIPVAAPASVPAFDF